MRARRLYGVDYDAMYEKQGGVCKICRKNFASLHVDHDHETGKPRGLLCHNCNVMVGYSLENITTLANAITYLNEHAGAERTTVPADSSVS